MTRPAPALLGTFYADAALLAGCLKRASAGQSFVYAKGAAIDPAHPVAALVRAEVAAQRASSTQRRAADGALEYLVKKLAVQPKPSGQAPTGGMEREARTSAQSAQRGSAAALEKNRQHPIAQDIYDILVRAAEAKRPCPSNDALAERLNLTDRHAARYRFDQLVAAGLIRVIEPGRYGPRVIEICSSGLRTRSVSASGGGHASTNVRRSGSMPGGLASPDRAGEKS